MKLLTTAKQFEQKVNAVLKRKIDAKLSKIAQDITPEVKKLISTAITQHQSWQSILSGKLRYHFGIPNPASKLSQILDIWVDSVHAEYKPARILAGVVTGKLVLVAIKANYSDVLDIAAAKQITEKKEVLPWLNWILTKGDEKVIQEYHIVVGPSEKSRTGEAIMSKTGLWGVPLDHTGTKENNMVTQAIESIRDDVLNLFKKGLTGV